MENVILIIEDDQDIRSFTESILTSNGFTTYSSGKGSQGLQLVETVSPNLVLLDLSLPDIAGESICKKIKADYPEIKVVMLTARSTPEDIAQGLNLGADDYVAKPFSEEVLIARVRARLRSSESDTQIITVADLVLNPQTHEVTRGKIAIELSAQEFKLLHYMMLNPNRVLSREMILSRIWGSSPDIETRVVDVYIGYLRKKIDKPFKQPLLHSIRGFGYSLKE